MGAPMTPSRRGDTEPPRPAYVGIRVPAEDEGRFIFGIEPHPKGRYGVTCYFDGCWCGMVVADTLEEAAVAAVRWHVTGELR